MKKSEEKANFSSDFLKIVLTSYISDLRIEKVFLRRRRTIKYLKRLNVKEL